MRSTFLSEAHGDIPAASHSLSNLDDQLLVGTVLAERYLGHYHHSTLDELADWLKRYRDYPDAPAIRALLLTRLPKGAALPPLPEHDAPFDAPNSDIVSADVDEPRANLTRNPGLDRTVLDRVQSGNLMSALRLITVTHGVSAAYAAQLRAEVAQVLFTRNEDADALRVARLALNEPIAADQPALAFYIGGLAAWRLDHIDAARTLFAGGATAPHASAGLRAASAFWASRASRALHDVIGTAAWLLDATKERLTLHGFLARRVLRMNTGIIPSGEVLTQADVDAVGGTEHGRRAYALLQIGQRDRAEAEFRALWSNARTDPVFGRSLLMVTAAAGLTDCAAQMAWWQHSLDGHPYDELRFPMPRLRPAGGFSIDPPLVYALTRLESNFDTGAVSPAGARGLMQIMPATARYMMGEKLHALNRLHEPAYNLDIGQRYIVYLARQDGINNDLLRILASYNSGPGNFYRWDMHDHGDPLLFIEAIPVPETRSFVQHALLYSWIYAAQMHMPASSLDALSAGEFPRFTAPGSGRRIALLSPEMN